VLWTWTLYCSVRIVSPSTYPGYPIMWISFLIILGARRGVTFPRYFPNVPQLFKTDSCWVVARAFINKRPRGIQYVIAILSTNYRCSLRVYESVSINLLSIRSNDTCQQSTRLYARIGAYLTKHVFLRKESAIIVHKKKHRYRELENGVHETVADDTNHSVPHRSAPITTSYNNACL